MKNRTTGFDQAVAIAHTLLANDDAPTAAQVVKACRAAWEATERVCGLNSVYTKIKADFAKV